MANMKGRQDQIEADRLRDEMREHAAAETKKAADAAAKKADDEREERAQIYREAEAAKQALQVHLQPSGGGLAVWLGLGLVIGYVCGKITGAQ